MPQVLHQVLSLPPTLHQAVRVMATRLVGELAEWIEQHPDTLQVGRRRLAPPVGLAHSCRIQKSSSGSNSTVLDKYIPIPYRYTWNLENNL